MTAPDVLRLYQELVARGIPIWIDGGWCVDALLGRQTRAHRDLDIAVERKFAAQLEQLLLGWGYQRRNGDQGSAWNYSMEQQGRVVDVHVFEFDENGKNVYGVPYPFGSLDGEGMIGCKVRFRDSSHPPAALIERRARPQDRLPATRPAGAIKVAA